LNVVIDVYEKYKKLSSSKEDLAIASLMIILNKSLKDIQELYTIKLDKEDDKKILLVGLIVWN